MNRAAGYWFAVGVTAMSLLVAGSAAASAGWFDSVTGRAKATKKSPWSTSNSRNGKAVITAKGVRPGQSGVTRILIGNDGSRPFRTMILDQDKATLGGISKELQLTVRDATTKRCLYPAWKPPKPRPGRKPPKEPTTCRHWGSWIGGKGFRNVRLRPKAGAVWRPRERHQIEVRWRLTPASPPSDQGRTASFRLKWRAKQ